MSRRLASLCLCAGLLLLVVQGTSGYTTTSGDRSVAVDVVDDERAYVQLQAGDRRLATGTNPNVRLLTVGNNVPSHITTVQVRVDDADDPSPATVAHSSVAVNRSAIPVGETAAVTADITCERAGSERLTVHLTVANDSFSTELSRSVTVTCPAPQTTTTAPQTSQSGGSPG